MEWSLRQAMLRSLTDLRCDKEVRWDGELLAKVMFLSDLRSGLCLVRRCSERTELLGVNLPFSRLMRYSRMLEIWCLYC